jgi:hypothetical protein
MNGNHSALSSNPDSRWRLSGTTLKYIAAVLMVFDHLHQFFLAQGAPTWFNMLGRPVLPIFLFMVVEGFTYTRNRKGYILRLLICFWVMNILNTILTLSFSIDNLPADLTPALSNNVFGTMFLTAFYLYAINTLTVGIHTKKGKWIALGVLLLILPIAVTVAVFVVMNTFIDLLVYQIVSFIPSLLTAEGGFAMVLMGILFYLFRRWRWAQMLVLAAFSVLSYMQDQSSGYNIQWMMVFAAIPLLLYNGKRGRGGKFNKYFFYVFYPAHIYLLYLIAWFLQR